MNSAIFRRGTRKGCGCMRGGSRSLDGQIANLTKSITYLSKRRNDPLYSRQQATNNAQIVRQTRNLKLLQNQKRAINAKAVANKAAVNKAAANAQIAVNKAAANARAANEAAKAQANFNTSVNNAAQAMNAEAANAPPGNKGVLTNVMNAVTKSLSGTSTSGQQAVVAANQSVAAANVAVNKTKKLQELAERANQLAKNIRSMTALAAGGKRNRRTRRK